MKASLHFSSNIRGLMLFTNNLLKYVMAFLAVLFSFALNAQQNQNVILDNTSPYVINSETLGRTLIGGDTIFVLSDRVIPLNFEYLEGNASNPIVVINKGGQVVIDGVAHDKWGALNFINCKYIKVSGKGHPGYKYGFKLSAKESGLAFAELSSDCEAENIKISHNGFFGIYAKKDYGGNPPNPIPVFDNLSIHDCFIEGVSEGMYIGETKSPGMIFNNLKVYNNIVRNTQRESIQVANTDGNTLIYNNTMINAGLEGLPAHQNNLQIGDNSVASIYNNIMMDAPRFGVINFGKGNVFVYNNYMENNRGVFLDERIISDTTMIMEVSNNYFKSLKLFEVIRNQNEINDFVAHNNIYDTNIPFYTDMNGVDNETMSNNVLGNVAGIQFKDPANNDYSLVSGTVDEYLGLGAPSGPEFFDYIEPEPEPTFSQIIITPSMVTDQVNGGSVYSALFLFDEQQINVNAGETPTSLSWKPYYNNTHAPYHVVVDLGSTYDISQINLHDMHDRNDFVVEYFDGVNWLHLFTEPCDSFKQWKRHDVNITAQYLRFSMYNSPYAAVNEIIIFGQLAEIVSEQIVIDPSMLVDLVDGGSVYSPNYLFDEQDVDIDAGEHPKSQNWKPYYNNKKAPYYVVVDLGQEYHITDIYIHDTHSTYNFDVDVEDKKDWLHLFTEPCDAYNVWKLHEVSTTTSKLRLSMLDNPYAGVNEIIIYGYPTYNSSVSKVENSISLTKANTKLSNENERPVLYPNPVKDNINLRIPNVDSLEKQNIKIFDLSGNLVYNMDVDMNNPTSVIQLNANHIIKSSGLYMLMYKNDKGVQETIKFYKI